MRSSYNQFKGLNPVGPVEFKPYGQGNLPSLINSGNLQSDPATVGDLSTETDWAQEARRVANANYQSMLNQGRIQVGQDINRRGLNFSSPVWRESLMQPYYGQANSYLANENKNISAQEMQYRLAVERMNLERELAQSRPDWLNLFTNLAGGALSAYAGYKLGGMGSSGGGGTV